MPYNLVKQGKGYKVQNMESGKFYEKKPIPLNRAKKQMRLLENLPAAGLGSDIAELATKVFGNMTSRFKKFLEEHGEEPVKSVTIGRVPLMKAIATVMNLVTLGKYDKVREKQGYDTFFHLFFIINDKYRIEKNSTVNVIVDYKQQENEERMDVSLAGLKADNINEFIQNGVDLMGEADYWGNYDGLVKNCQNFTMKNMQANGIYSPAIKDFAFQNTDELIADVDPLVQKGAFETTQLLEAADKFLSWLSGGRWGVFAKGGTVRRIGL